MLAQVHHCPELAPQFLYSPINNCREQSYSYSIYLRVGIRERDSEGLDQITTACTHAGPESKTVLLGARSLGQNQGGVGLPDPRLSRAQRKVRAESDRALAVSGTNGGQEGKSVNSTHCDESDDP